jgi:hypothetical protein
LVRSPGGDEVEPVVYIQIQGDRGTRATDGWAGWCTSIADSIGLFAPYLMLEGGSRGVPQPALDRRM